MWGDVGPNCEFEQQREFYASTWSTFYNFGIVVALKRAVKKYVYHEIRRIVFLDKTIKAEHCWLHAIESGPEPGGILTYLAERGCAALMGRFLQEILKHGSHFLPKKSLNMRQLFCLSPNFRGFRMAKTPKIAKVLKNGPIFQEKTLKMGTLFCQNHL